MRVSDKGVSDDPADSLDPVPEKNIAKHLDIGIILNISYIIRNSFKNIKIVFQIRQILIMK